jgi:hypothetical protein
MFDDEPLLTLVPSADGAGDRLPVRTAVRPFDALAPDLEALGVEQAARRGDRLARPMSEPGLRIVTKGVLCLTHGETGLCTALVGEGAPAGPAGGHWLTDGAFVDISFDTLRERYGGSTALAVWMRASDLSRAAVESELVCFVRHAASRRFARWLLALMKDADTTVMTQTELARLAGLQRTSVCAAMATLQAGGALKVTRGRIVLQDRAALAREACGCARRRPASEAVRPPGGDSEAAAGMADPVRRFAG